MKYLQFSQQKFANRLNLAGLLIFYALLFGGLALVLTRSNHNFWNTVPVIGAYNLNNHFMNFVLSAQILGATGFGALLGDKNPWKYILSAAAVIIGLNIIMELYVTLANTRDIRDIFAGVAGAGIGLLILSAIHKLGIDPVKRK